MAKPVRLGGWSHGHSLWPNKRLFGPSLEKIRETRGKSLKLLQLCLLPHEQAASEEAEQGFYAHCFLVLDKDGSSLCLVQDVHVLNKDWREAHTPTALPLRSPALLVSCSGSVWRQCRLPYSSTRIFFYSFNVSLTVGAGSRDGVKMNHLTEAFCAFQGGCCSVIPGSGGAGTWCLRSELRSWATRGLSFRREPGNIK